MSLFSRLVRTRSAAGRKRPLTVLLCGAVTVLVAFGWSGSFDAVAAGPGGERFAFIGGGESSGFPVAGSGPNGTTIRFINRGTFWLGVLLQNNSRRVVTLVGASTPEPARSLVRQVSARFAPFTPCRSARLGCPFLADPRHPPTPPPLTVGPRHYVAIKLSYRLVSCTAARNATTASGDLLTVSYRSGGAGVQQQSFKLGAAKLRLHRPAGIECVPRPYSHIGLVGSFTTSPGHGTFPGSDGDTCARTAAGALRFRSRLFPDRNGIAWRVEIDLPHYLGTGAYGHPRARIASLGKAVISLTGGFGDRGATTFRDVDGTVTVTRATRRTFAGRFEAVLSGHRRFFRAYGAWRCALLP
jgi:hypothetical protein